MTCAANGLDIIIRLILYLDGLLPLLAEWWLLLWMGKGPWPLAPSYRTHDRLYLCRSLRPYGTHSSGERGPVENTGASTSRRGTNTW
jgi:hypothetical protein